MFVKWHLCMNSPFTSTIVIASPDLSGRGDLIRLLRGVYTEIASPSTDGSQ